MKIIKNNKILATVFMFVGAICLFSTFFKNSNVISVYAMEQQSEDVLDEQVIVDTSEVELLSGGKTSDDIVLLEGTNEGNFTKTRSRNSLSDTKYIANANYFLINPKHSGNDSNVYPKGTCTTIAMQMLLGYHNYYSDRRIIPSPYLDSDYGNISLDPFFSRSYVLQQGCPIIGTGDNLYEELINLNGNTSGSNYGQAIPWVVNAAKDFLEQNAEDIEDNISITWDLFSDSQARSDIDAGKPVIICYNSIFSSEVHVVVAYGYAKLEGEDGFLTHSGWGDAGILVWVPEELINFQIRMDVEHEHDFIRTGNFVVDYAVELMCTECGYKKLERLYDMEEGTIVGVNASLVGDVTIPSMFEQYLQESALFVNQSVSAIGVTAFANQAQITNITIPNTVTSIGNDAFNGCERLKSIVIPGTVTEIGDGVFEGCTSLTSVTLPTTITKINDRMFKGCTNLISFTIPSNITEIGASAFKCSGLTAISIPNTVMSIGDEAFCGCSFLTNATIQSSISVLPYRLFYKCEYLGKVDLPDGLTEIKDEVFYECEKLTSIELPSSLSNIGNGVFAYAGLNSIEIPNDVNSICKEAFLNCYYLTNVKFPASLTEIQEGAFYGCMSLTSFIIPNGVEKIGDYAFCYCGSMGQIIIPSTVLNMGNSVFADCAPISLYVETHSDRPSGWAENWAGDGIILWQTALSDDNSYVLSFYKNSTDANYYANMQSPTRFGYTFSGWSQFPDFSGALYESGQICTVTESGTFYACWAGETLDISYKDVGGTRFSGIHAVGYPTTHTNGTDTALLRPSRLNYTFMGWYLNPEGTGAPINAIDGDELYDSTITVYAKWKKVSFTPITPTAIINLDSIEMMSANGSYIDGEGNVYLVEEDIEAYLNGTLTFYKKDDNLETV